MLAHFGFGHHAAAILIIFLLGLGAGRIKNAAKLEAIREELKAVETSAVEEVKKLVTAIKTHL